MHSFAPFFNLKISAKNRQHFFANEKWISDFSFSSSNFAFSAKFWWNFVRISRQIPEKSDVCRFFNQICENKLENCRKFWNLWKLFNIIQYYSFVSLLSTQERWTARTCFDRRSRRPAARPRPRHDWAVNGESRHSTCQAWGQTMATIVANCLPKFARADHQFCQTCRTSPNVWANLDSCLSDFEYVFCKCGFSLHKFNINLVKQ